MTNTKSSNRNSRRKIDTRGNVLTATSPDDSYDNSINVLNLDERLILISYDIKGRNPRRKFREKIKSLSAVKRNDSDYIAIFTPKLWEDMNKVKNEEGAENFSIDIIAIATSEAQMVMLKEKYETNFVAQFDAVDKKLDYIRLAFVQDESTWKEDPKTGEKRPVTSKNLFHMVTDVEHEIGIITKALDKRREVSVDEFKLDEKTIQQFEHLEKKIENFRLKADKYSGAIRAQIKREDKGYGKGPAGPFDKGDGPSDL